MAEPRAPASGAADLATLFHRYGRIDAVDLESPLYSELAHAISLDGELLALAAEARAGQPPPNMLWGAVQYLLLRGAEHPLAAHYPIVSGAERPMEPAAPAFKDFCRLHRGEIAELLRTRRTQTNVVRRCTCLLPAFALVSREAQRPLALIDLGTSAGLNLAFDRYGYRYARGGAEAARWNPGAQVQLEAELRRGAALPQLPAEIPVASRAGVDLNPIDLADEDQLLWLRALIWPEHVERHQRLIDAAAELAESGARLMRGDAAEALPGLIADTPADAAVTVLHTVAAYQFPAGALESIEETLLGASAARPIWRVWLEALPGAAAPRYALALRRYRDGKAGTERLAIASPHGWWIEPATG